jgi:electron transport complex protein RnfC
VKLQRGVKLEQQKTASLKQNIQALSVPQGIAASKPLAPRLGKLDAAAIIAAAEAAQIVDEFDGEPLFKKLKRMHRFRVKTVLACCFDEDPYTSSAMATLRENTDAIIAGLVLAAKACGAQENKIAVAGAREARVIQRMNPQADLVLAGERYPARELLRQKLRNSGDTTAYIGAQACAALTAAVDNGRAQDFTVVTVAGDAVEDWCNVKVRIGVPLQVVLDSFEINPKAALVITGSSITGKAITDLSQPVTAATRCVIVLKKAPRNRTYPCIGCQKCVRACPHSIRPWLIYHEMKRAKPDLLRLPNVQKCIGCAACSVACPSGIDLAGTVAKAAERKKSGDFD